MVATARFDVVVVGASIAGCTSARLFALAGARVALVERRPDPGAYKVVCTHQILSSAVPTIERARPSACSSSSVFQVETKSPS